MISLDFRYPDKPLETTPKVIEHLDPSEWICNAKYDGWRLQCYFISPSNVQFLTRLGKPMNTSCSLFNAKIQNSIKQLKLPGKSVIDAEFIGPRGHLSPAIYIFDMLAWKGSWLVNEHYEQRWKRCKELVLPTNEKIYLAETVNNDFLVFFERLKKAWNNDGVKLYEGIVVKHRKGKLKLNRTHSEKSNNMLKCKFRDIWNPR